MTEAKKPMIKFIAISRLSDYTVLYYHAHSQAKKSYIQEASHLT